MIRVLLQYMIVAMVCVVTLFAIHRQHQLLVMYVAPESEIPQDISYVTPLPAQEPPIIDLSTAVSQLAGFAFLLEGAPVSNDAPQEVVVEDVVPTSPLTVSESHALVHVIHRMTNEIRTRHGQEPLAHDPDLAVIAQAHSADMGKRGYLDHVSPDGCDYTCRLHAYGYTAMMWAENIIWREGSSMPETEQLAADFMESWMGSGGHRNNILSPDYTQAGIGVYHHGDVVYVTVNFARN